MMMDGRLMLRALHEKEPGEWLLVSARNESADTSWVGEIPELRGAVVETYARQVAPEVRSYEVGETGPWDIYVRFLYEG